MCWVGFDASVKSRESRFAVANASTADPSKGAVRARFEPTPEANFQAEPQRPRHHHRNTQSPGPVIETPALAVDFGEVRIGLAVSDDRGRVALPLDTLDRTTDRRAAYAIAALAAERGIRSLVVGAPRHLDGTPSDNLDRVRRFAARLAKAAKRPTFLVEETLSTAEADARLEASSRRARVRDRRRDMVAAQVILEDALAGAARRLRTPNDSEHAG